MNQAGARSGKNDYALVIGIDDYVQGHSSGGLRKLNGANGDATDIALWLTEEARIVDRKNCHLITSTGTPLGPLRDRIESDLQELINDASHDPLSNNRLFFYFAGHGLGVDLDVDNNALCLANWSGLARNAALSSKEYLDVFIRFSLFKQVFLMADCCRNTRFSARPLASNLDPNQPMGPYNTKRFVAFATQYRGKSFETVDQEGITRGIFTRVLLDGLRGAAADPSSGKTTPVSLKNYLDMNTPIEASKQGFIQEPDVHFNLATGEILFA